MGMEIYKGVIIVEGPGQEFEREIPPDNKKVVIYEVNAIAIDNDGGIQKILTGGKGFGLSRAEAWQAALNHTKSQVDKIKQ